MFGPPSYLGAQPEFCAAAAEIYDGAGHISITPLVLAHRVAMREAKNLGDAVRVTVIAAGFDHNAPAKVSPLTTTEPAMTEGPRSDIFTSTTNDDFFDVGGDDDLPSFLR